MCGCMQLKAVPHMDELLTLQAYSDEKESQIQWVEGKQKQFEDLLSAVKDGSIKNYVGQNAVAEAFGPPVISDQIEEQGQPVTRWLYRHQIQRFVGDRVYLYFKSDGQLIKSELIPSK